MIKESQTFSSTASYEPIGFLPSRIRNQFLRFPVSSEYGAVLHGSLCWAYRTCRETCLCIWYLWHQNQMSKSIMLWRWMCYPEKTLDALFIRIALDGPGWCSSVHWVQAWEPKGHLFDSQSGHMPGLWVRSPIGGMWEATTHWCFSPSLPPFPSL